MTTKIEKCFSAYLLIKGCLYCSDANYLWYYKEEWIIDTDDGLKGYVAKFCPNCGKKLPAVSVKESE